MAKRRRASENRASRNRAGRGHAEKQAEQLTEEAAKTSAAVSPRAKAPSRATWKVMDRGTSVAAGLLATRASAVAWRAVTGKKPPTSGQHPDVTTREAMVWAVVGGSIVELVRVGVRRSAATYWVRSTGQLPPGMKPLGTPATVARATAAGTTKEPVLPEPAPHTSRRASARPFSRRSRGR